MRYASRRDMMISALERTNLTDAQRAFFSFRYMEALDMYCTLHGRVEVLYTVLRVIVTVGSLITPALLTVQRDAAISVYWITFLLSLMVTIANALIELFSLQKRSRVYWLTFKKLDSDGWKFLQLCGKYHHYNHSSCFEIFASNVEIMCAAAVAELAATSMPPMLSRSYSVPNTPLSAVSTSATTENTPLPAVSTSATTPSPNPTPEPSPEPTPSPSPAPSFIITSATTPEPATSTLI